MRISERIFLVVSQIENTVIQYMIKRQPRTKKLSPAIILWQNILKEHRISGVLRKTDARYPKIKKEFEARKEKEGI